MSDTGIVITVFAVAIALIILGVLVYYLVFSVPPYLSARKKRKQQRQAIEYFHNRIGMKLKMYDETCALCEIVKCRPELKQDVEEYIKIRNEYYGIDYDLTNVSGGKEDGKI